jgi:hypothetical protein
MLVLRGVPEIFADLVETFYIYALQSAWNIKYPPINHLIRPYIELALKDDSD